MLDESEFALIRPAYEAGIRSVRQARRVESRPLIDADHDTLYREVAALYKQITGVGDIDAREILHHRFSRLGPQCKNCRELRTPCARKCLECGSDVAEHWE